MSPGGETVWPRRPPGASVPVHPGQHPLKQLWMPLQKASYPAKATQSHSEGPTNVILSVTSKGKPLLLGLKAEMTVN